MTSISVEIQVLLTVTIKYQVPSIQEQIRITLLSAQFYIQSLLSYTSTIEGIAGRWHKFLNSSSNSRGGSYISLREQPTRLYPSHWQSPDDLDFQGRIILVLERLGYLSASGQLVNLRNKYAYVLECMLMQNDKVRVSVHKSDSDDLDLAVKTRRAFNCHITSPCTPWL